MEDAAIPNKLTWDTSLRFMEAAVVARLEQTKKRLTELKGPGFQEQWLRWTYPTEAQRQCSAAVDALGRILKREPDHKPNLGTDEMSVVRKTLSQDTGMDIDDQYIRDVWHHLYRVHFLDSAAAASRNCRNFFFHYQKGFSQSEIDCNAVVLFWRVQKMLQATSNSLRQQITNTEGRRLEKEIKEVLDDWSENSSLKQELLTGRRVELAEELKQVRLIQEKVEEFIQALKTEKP